MKRLFYLLVAFSALALASCSSSDAPKDIKPTSTEFTSGELAKLIEVVDEPCQLSYVEKDGAVATQFIQLKIRLKLTKESPELQNIDARDINFIGLLSVATINLVDENGIKVQDLNVKSDDLLKLKKLLQGKEGDEETITFEGEFHNHDDAPKWFEQAAAFTPYLTGDVDYPKDNVYEQDYGTQTEDTSFEWLSERKLTSIDLEGLSSDELRIMRNSIYARHGRLFKSADLRQYFNSQSWYNGYRDEVPESEMNANEKYNIQFIKSYEEGGNVGNLSYESNDFNTGGGDASVDEFLDEYEKFWRKYMNFIKKMDKKDPTAMAEYGQLLIQYNEYAQKLQKIKGEVSIDQLNRLNKMNAELLSEMQKIQK